jgi:methionyl-tRNA synthetase
MHMDKTVYKEDIEEELRRIREELDSLEDKLRKNQLRDAIRQLDYIIDDVDKLIDDVERYDPLDDVDDEDIAYVCHNWGCKCSEG